jgi:hypothetical protein
LFSWRFKANQTNAFIATVVPPPLVATSSDKAIATTRSRKQKASSENANNQEEHLLMTHNRVDNQMNAVILSVGGRGECHICFEGSVVRRLFHQTVDGDWFGLRYNFTLVEGSSHARGVGDAVNFHERLDPLPLLMRLT